MKRRSLIVITLFFFQMVFAGEILGKSYLMINAQVYFGAEDEKSVPIETDFYLLDNNIVNILKESGFKPLLPDRQRRELNDNDFLEATAEAFTADDSEAKLVRLLIENTLARHKIALITTDNAGTAYAPVPIGKYYLFAVGKAEGQTLVWNSAVEVKDGRNNIEADQYNADLISED